MADLEQRVEKVEGRVTKLEVVVEGDRERFKLGAEHMAKTDRKVEVLESSMHQLAGQIRDDNQRANEKAATDSRHALEKATAATETAFGAMSVEIEKLKPRPLPGWMRQGLGVLCGMLVAVLGFTGKAIWDQHATQAEQAERIHEIQDSAARQEATLRELDAVIRGKAPGKAETP